MVYCLRSFGLSRKIMAFQRFFAANDGEAVSMAPAKVDGAAAVARFDLWEGKHRIHDAAPHDERKASPGEGETSSVASLALGRLGVLQLAHRARPMISFSAKS